MSTNRDATLLLAEGLGLPPEAVPADARIGSVEQWDSLAHARILIALEAALGRTIDAEEILRVESLADIAALLAARG